MLWLVHWGTLTDLSLQRSCEVLGLRSPVQVLSRTLFHLAFLDSYLPVSAAKKTPPPHDAANLLHWRRRDGVGQVLRDVGFPSNTPLRIMDK